LSCSNFRLTALEGFPYFITQLLCLYHFDERPQLGNWHVVMGFNAHSSEDGKTFIFPKQSGQGGIVQFVIALWLAS
jgi:hypothetical protein